MKTTANARFAIQAWDEQPWDEAQDRPKLTRAIVTRTYTGDIEGEGRTEYLMLYRSDGTATFVGLERVVGRLAGREGSFVLRRTGVFEDGQAKEDYAVVPGSGAGELGGLVGDGRSSVGHGLEHPFTLAYEFVAAGQATPSPEIYPMPSFPTLVVRDPEASSRWYQKALGFQHVFTIPGPGGAALLVHLRWARYADLLLRRDLGPPDAGAKGAGISLSFAVFEGRVDDVAERAQRSGARLETALKDQPWNARDFSIRDPDGFLLTFTQGPVEKDITMDRIVRRAMGEERGPA